MRKLILLCFMIMVAFSSCKDDISNNNSALLTNDWKLIRIESLSDGSTITKPVDENEDVLFFITDNQPDSFTFNGRGPVNSFEGKFIKLKNKSQTIIAVSVSNSISL